MRKSLITDTRSIKSSSSVSPTNWSMEYLFNDLCRLTFLNKRSSEQCHVTDTTTVFLVGRPIMSKEKLDISILSNAYVLSIHLHKPRSVRKDALRDTEKRVDHIELTNASNLGLNNKHSQFKNYKPEPYVHIR